MPKEEEIGSNVRIPWQFKAGNNYPNQSSRTPSPEAAALQSFFEANKVYCARNANTAHEKKQEKLQNIEQVNRI